MAGARAADDLSWAYPRREAPESDPRASHHFVSQAGRMSVSTQSRLLWSRDLRERSVEAHALRFCYASKYHEAGAAHLRRSSGAFLQPWVVCAATIWPPVLRARPERSLGILLEPSPVYVQHRQRQQLRIPPLSRRLVPGLSQGRQRLPDCPAAFDSYQLSLAVKRCRSRQRPYLRLSLDLRRLGEHLDVH